MNAPPAWTPAPPDACPRCGTGTVINLSTQRDGPRFMCAQCGRDLPMKRDTLTCSQPPETTP